MWPKMLATHGLKTPGDITIYGCRVWKMVVLL
jgi:hypothetical protein